MSELPTKDLIAQGGLGVVLVVVLLMLAASIKLNFTLVKWVRDLYEKHTDKVLELAREQQKSAEEDRAGHAAHAAEVGKLRTSVDTMSATVQTQGSLLHEAMRAVLGRKPTPGSFPAVDSKESR